ncbi:hypothetical protein BH10ACT1_BH10ACT1_43400 [soil metagenome]
MALVAVVCNDADGREVLARVIERAGHEVRRLDGSDGALGLLRTERVDRVLLDLHDPETSNQVLLERLVRPDELDRGDDRAGSGQGPGLRNEGPPIRTIVIGSDDGDARAAWWAGADHWLARPFPARRLTDVVDEVVARPEHERLAHRIAELAHLPST